MPRSKMFLESAIGKQVINFAKRRMSAREKQKEKKERKQENSTNATVFYQNESKRKDLNPTRLRS